MEIILTTQSELQTIVLTAVQQALSNFKPPQVTSTTDLPERPTRNQVAKYLDCSLVTLHKMDLNGTLPAVRLGRMVRYKREDVLNCMKSRKRLKIAN